MIAAIGDVHGCSYEFLALLKKVMRFFNGRPGEIVLLGDYIDRGYDSKGVIDIIRQWDHPLVKLICLKGNHEEMMIRAVLGNELAMERMWLTADSGGGAAVASFGDDIVEYAQWMRANLRSFYRTSKLYFAHAGIVPELPLEDQEDDVLLWIGKRFLQHPNPCVEGLKIIHGHTVTTNPVMLPHRIGVDTGCVFGGRLTAALFNDDEEHIGFEQVRFSTK